ncbi:methylated-DNA/protein-cysteine methyltransferase [Hyaloraphidium curvatum]|nr:methylated-DNA/protein-cysteine methyltransferase [Hyaloraphidium curvatum]
MAFYDTLKSPVGEILIIANVDGALTHLYTRDPTRELARHPGAVRDAVRLTEPRRQLEEYFAGTRKEFNLELAPKGSPYQRRVWEKLREIPAGETRTYAQLASELGVASARAVGRANATNPISIIIPCHRLVGSNGTLTGYAGGLEAKEWLLKHEGSRTWKQAKERQSPRKLARPAS